MLEVLREMSVLAAPLVPRLMPVTLSCLNDHDRGVRALASKAFGLTVKLAPLVDKKEAGDGVIGHLIHGEPLPALDLPAALRGDGRADLRGYQVRRRLLSRR